MTQPKSDARERRAERLAAALKEKLRRRQAQARGRAADAAAGQDNADPREAAPEADDEP
jgi:hypothetical protein